MPMIVHSTQSSVGCLLWDLRNATSLEQPVCHALAPRTTCLTGGGACAASGELVFRVPEPAGWPRTRADPSGVQKRVRCVTAGAVWSLPRAEVAARARARCRRARSEAGCRPAE